MSGDREDTSDPDIITNIIGDDDYGKNHRTRSVSKKPVSEDHGLQKALYICEICEATFKRKAGLLRHQQSVHEGAKYFCTKCEYQATREDKLKFHHESKHEGVTYSCYQCEYQVTLKSSLTTHQQSVHQGRSKVFLQPL
jgi:hypothetical protein